MLYQNSKGAARGTNLTTDSLDSAETYFLKQSLAPLPNRKMIGAGTSILSHRSGTSLVVVVRILAG
jgi:hypothetical protein